MTMISETEPRCLGRDSKNASVICRERDACARHIQVGLDYDAGFVPGKSVKILHLPRVGAHQCWYRIEVKP